MHIFIKTVKKEVRQRYVMLVAPRRKNLSLIMRLIVGCHGLKRCRNAERIIRKP